MTPRSAKTSPGAKSGGKSGKAGRARLRFGPAGWMYKDWEGDGEPEGQPAPGGPLPFIPRFFDTIEINSSFYGPPVARTAASWVKRVEEHRAFRFTAKLWK